MAARVTVEKWCCPECGGHRVERLDWVSANSDTLIGDDPGDSYWCPDCETHPARLEQRPVTFELCDSCSAHHWGTPIPLPGVLATPDGAIETCDTCRIYESDSAAASALADEMTRRGDSPRVRVFVDGYEF